MRNTTSGKDLPILVALMVSIVVSAAGAQTVRYIPKHDELKYTFGGHAPVMSVASGTVIESWTEDCYDGLVKSPTDIPSKIIPANHDNPQTGPFFIEGAEPGDVLAVRILKLEPALPYGISSSFPFFGALTATEYTAMLHEALPERVWWYDVDKAKGTVRFRALNGKQTVDIPMRPFLGCLGVAPARGEVRWTVTPEAYGGNMDCPEVCEGNTVYLPVNVKGGLLYFGDGHLVQGDGEIISTAVEAAMNVRLQVDVIKGKDHLLAAHRERNGDHDHGVLPAPRRRLSHRPQSDGRLARRGLRLRYDGRLSAVVPGREGAGLPGRRSQLHGPGPVPEEVPPQELRRTVPYPA